MKNKFLFIAALCLAAPLQAQQQETPAPLSADEVAARFKAPTTITLQAQDTPVMEVFESFMKQAGTSYQARNIAAFEKMSISVQNQPFWDAALAFQKASGWGLFYGSSGGRGESHYTLARSRTAGGLKSSSGPLTGYVTSVQRIKTASDVLQFGEVFRVKENEQHGKNVSDQLKLNVQTLLDPAVPLVTGSAELSLIEAVDENGQAVFAPASGSRGGAWKLDGSFSATPVAEVPPKIARLKIGYRCFVGLDSQTLTFENVTEGTPQKQAGLRGEATENYEIVEAKTVPAGFSLTLKANRPNDGMEFSRTSSTMFNDVVLVDATNKQWIGQLGYTGDRTGVSNPAPIRQYEARVAFGRPGDTFPGPLKVIWTIPSKFQAFETVLEWKDVPLP